MQTQRWVLAQRPDGLPAPGDFKLETSQLPEPKDGEALIAVEHVSVDPGMRSRLSGDSYAAALGLGETIESAGVGRVLKGNARLPEGALVMGGFGWASHAVSDGRGVQVLDPAVFSGSISATASIGVLGIPGLTAYFGLTDLGKPQADETLLVSSAAGPVGATTVQIGKQLGLRVIGIAGGDAKTAYVRDILKADAVIDHRVGDLTMAINKAAPQGIDIYFDNVGGEQLDAAILNMKPKGRIVVSGQVSEYNAAEPRGIRWVTPFITKRLRMEGLVVYDYRKQFGEAQAAIAGWIRSGALSYREEIIDGFEKLPEAFIGLFRHENFGRRLVRI
ncbi:Putative NADP-dependent oxidoreductase YfmJ [Alphaproteobacteria bacterium SO-S41]|nr:Putative NADP-dependent oxidoreductase YfmJ [Alphaproteobacteria bacterium SO-S41]